MVVSASLNSNTHRGIILDTPSRIITSRVTTALSGVIDEVSSELGMSKSDFIRQSIRSLYKTILEVMQITSIKDMDGVHAEIAVVEGAESL